MKTIFAFGRRWPFTGREAPELPDLERSIRHVHPGWDDLCWWDRNRKLWVYLSTLPSKETQTP